MYRAVQFKDIVSACRLMQAVDILCNNRNQFAGTFKFRKLIMSCIGLCMESKHFVAVKIIKILCIIAKKRMAEYFLGRKIIFLIIQTVGASEIGYSAFGRNAGAAEKDYFV